MQTAILFLHNIFRWVILILLLLSLFNSLSGWQNGKTLGGGSQKLWLFTLISGHINLLIGLYLLFFGRYGIVTGGIPEGVQVMKDKFYRFFWIEHPFGMILAVIFITLGRGMVKKPVSDTIKFKRAFWFYLLALIFILATVPWPFREIVGRPWI
jgi:hypothetical protein